jgi:hypothetical protein
LDALFCYVRQYFQTPHRKEDRNPHPRTVSFPTRDATKRKIETVHFNR